MKIGTSHLSYCTNIHAGETWPEVFDSLRGPLLRVRERLVPHEPFGIGLRLSALAASQLEQRAAFEQLCAFLAEHQLYVFTLNGFPYGTFHGAPVKDGVYLPDWTRTERGEYTRRLIRLLARLLPAHQTGSISTVPGGFKPHLRDAPEAPALIADQLHRQVEELVRLRDERGVEIALALEPEPGCLLETSAETVAFFERFLLDPQRLRQLARRLGGSPGAAEAHVRRHLGVCLDACHAAVEFEAPGAALDSLFAHGIRIAKLQLSAGLRITQLDPNTLDRLRQFDEPVYLHQTVARLRSGELLHFSDLPLALASDAARGADEWRVHFHVPLHREQLEGFVNTQPWLVQLLDRHAQRAVCSHLEVETYTWSVLPREYRERSLVDSIADELTWVRGRLLNDG